MENTFYSNIINLNTNRLVDAVTHFKENLQFSNTENNLIGLRCILSKKAISNAVKGSECIHLECYDEKELKEYLTRKETLECLKCDKLIHSNNIIRDFYLDTIIRFSKNENNVIEVKKSSGKWKLVKKNDMINYNQENNEIHLLNKYLNDIDSKSIDILIYPNMHERNLNTYFLINKNLNQKQLFYLTNFNFSSINQPIYHFDNIVNLFINFKNLKKFEKNNLAIFEIIDIFTYFNYILMKCNAAVITIDEDFIDFFKFIYGNNYLFIIYHIKFLMRNMPNLLLIISKKPEEANMIKEYLERMDENENLNNRVEFSTSLDEFLLKKYNNLEKEIHSCFIHSEIADQRDETYNKKILENFLSTSAEKEKIKFIINEPSEFNDEFYITNIKSDENNFIINNTFNSVRYMIVENDMIYSNFTNVLEYQYLHPVKINNEDFSKLIISNKLNYDLLCQLTEEMYANNFFFTNQENINSNLSINIMNKLNIEEFLNISSQPGNRSKVFLLFIEKMTKIELESLLDQKFIKAEKNLFEKCDIISSYEDENKSKYYFFLEEENDIKILVRDDIDKMIGNILKNKISSINSLTFRRSTLINERINYEIRKYKE